MGNLEQMQFTNSQKKALDLSRNTALIAGAGSGKTTVLTRRYLNLLLEKSDLDIENVAAITFTDDAASKMSKDVHDLIFHNQYDPAEQKRVKEIKENLYKAKITTIHSLCTSILYEFYIEAGVAADFQVLDDAKQRILLKNVINKFITETVRIRDNVNPLKNHLYNLLNCWSIRQFENIIHNLMNKKYIVREISDNFLSKSDDELFNEWHSEFIENQKKYIDEFINNTNIKPLLKYIISHLPSEHNNTINTFVKNILPLIEAKEYRFESVDNYKYLIAFFLTSDGGIYKRIDRRKFDLKIDIIYESFFQASEIIYNYKNYFDNLITEFDKKSIYLIKSLCYVFKAVLDKYREGKGNGTFLDYDELLTFTLDLLENNPHISRMLSSRFRYILVDEFQDVDPIQWRIITLLLGGDKGIFDKDKLFIVGDPQQSIYGFRNADIRIFGLACDKIREINKSYDFGNIPLEFDEILDSSIDENLGKITMSDNFRSLAAPINFINHIFDKIFIETSRDFDFEIKKYIPLSCSRDAEGRVGGVEITCLTGENIIGTFVEKEADLIANKIIEITNSDSVFSDILYTHKDIAILLRNKTHAHIFEEQLKKYNIPFYFAKGSGLYERQEVYDILNLLTFLSNPKDDIAILGVVRSPFFRISDNILYKASSCDGATLFERLSNLKEGKRLKFTIEILNKYLKLSSYKSPSYILNSFFDDTAYWAIVQQNQDREQISANIKKIMQIISDFEGAEFTTVYELVQYLSTLIDSDSNEVQAQLEPAGEHSVKIMTIHSSKGLQFPILFLPELHSSDIKSKISKNSILINEEIGIGLKLADDANNLKTEEHYLFKKIKKLEENKQSAEEKRVFYVACTRCEDYLFLSGKYDKEDDDKSALAWSLKHLGLGKGNIDEIENEKTYNFSNEQNSFNVKISNIKIEKEEKTEITFRERFANIDEAFQNKSEKSESKENTETKEISNDRILISPIEHVEKITEISTSDLLLFKKCPVEYVLKKLFSIDGNLISEKLGFNDSAISASEKGTIFHNTVSYFIKNMSESDSNIENFIRKEMAKRIDLSAQDKNTLYDDILNKIKIFQSNKEIKSVLQSGILYAELPFSIKINSVNINGIIDLMYKDDGGNWNIIDYKTNNISEDQLDMTAKSYELQVSIYSIFLQKLFSERKLFSPILYFTAIDKSYRFEYSLEELISIEKKISGMIDEINLIMNNISDISDISKLDCRSIANNPAYADFMRFLSDKCS